MGTDTARETRETFYRRCSRSSPDKNTVNTQRKALELTGEIHQFSVSIGADGKERPRQRKPVAVFNPTSRDKIPYDKWFERGYLRLCTGNSINYSDVTQWFVEIVRGYELFPAWVYYDSYSARYFVEEMTLQGFNMVRCIQGAKTLSLPMQMLGADLQAHRVTDCFF